MTDLPLNFSLSTYLYDLPEDLIAKEPASPRDSSRLMLIDRSSGAPGAIAHRIFNELPELLMPGDVLVANNSRVIPARLLGRRVLCDKGQETLGGQVEFFLLKPASKTFGENAWEGLFHAAVKHRPGVEFEIPARFPGQPLRGVLVTGASESPSGTVIAHFNRDPLTDKYGQVPLPPYLNAPNEKDTESYQTIYAKNDGSSAAPTAGLHFTKELLKKLHDRGIDWEEITLHVGLGTFRPVKSDDIRAHVMHEETYEIEPRTADRLNRARNEGRRMIAVGTTALRCLESAFDPEAGYQAGPGSTRIFLYPGGPQARAAQGLITNFHLPGSTLLMLVCGFSGTDFILSAYAQAIAKRYRFFSYGDAMLLLSKEFSTNGPVVL